VEQTALRDSKPGSVPTNSQARPVLSVVNIIGGAPNRFRSHTNLLLAGPRTDRNASTGTSLTGSLDYRNGALDLSLLLPVQSRVGTEVFHLGAQYLAVELEGSLIVVLDSNW